MTDCEELTTPLIFGDLQKTISDPGLKWEPL
ncbi:MAG: hypothetical protein V7632_2133, partial [Bradyrhizobium sp.]